MAGKKESKSKAKGKNQKKKQKEDRINCIFAFLQNKKNIILQGAPGTGKTYKTAELALAIVGCLPKRVKGDTENVYHKKVMEEYGKRLVKFDDKGKIIGDGQISFVTFHQSMDYEDFVEGIKSKTNKGVVSYNVEDGIFKTICEHANSNCDVETVFENFCSDLEVKLNKSKNGINLWDGSNFKMSKVKRYKKDNRACSILLRNGKTSLKPLTLDVTQEYYPKYKKGEIKSPDDIMGSTGKKQGNAEYYFHFFAELLKFENKKSKKTFESKKKKNYVLIIDEINRGNVSKIFGELISLLEADKRAGGDHPLTVTLPYSKEQFSVPSNLYIIGTMNTTDRSVGSIDYAVRRRFAFVTLEANENLVLEVEAHNLFNAVKNFIEKSKYDMDIEDLMVGHSYFMNANNLQMKWQYEILPLLMEYHKDGIISKSPLKDAADKDIADVKKNYANFTAAWKKPDSDTSKS